MLPSLALNRRRGTGSELIDFSRLTMLWTSIIRNEALHVFNLIVKLLHGPTSTASRQPSMCRVKPPSLSSILASLHMQLTAFQSPDLPEKGDLI